MKLIDKYNEVKRKNNDQVVLIRSGIFYDAFGNDAYIMSYLFGYKIKEITNTVMIGFPISVIDNVRRRFAKEKIVFLILDDNKISESPKPIGGNYYNYDMLLDISKKCYLIENEINIIKEKLVAIKECRKIADAKAEK